MEKKMNMIAKSKCISNILIYIMICCLFFSCTSTQADKQNKTNLEILIKRPCWLKTKPENCEIFKNTKDNWIYLVDHIITRNKSEEMNEHQQQVLLTQLNAQYIAKLKSKILNEIKYYAECINEETKDQCKALFQKKLKLISKATIQANEIDICEIFWESTSTPGEWKLFGLAKFDKNRYLDKLNLVLKRKSLSTTQEPGSIKPSEMQYVYSISSPSEMTDIFEIPFSKYIEDPEEITTCKDIQFNFIPLPKRATFDDCISSIQNSFKKLYSQNRAGTYFDDRILETHSECMKKGEGCNTERDYVVVEDEMEKKYNRIVSCWQSRTKQLEAEYINKKKEALLSYRDAHHNITRFNHILHEWSYEISVQIKFDEEINLIYEMYQQKEKLLNTYYLVFTIATSEYRHTNALIIRKYSIKLAKNEILKQATKYNILKNILLDNSELKHEKILANYNIRILPDHSSQLKIIPRQYIAKIMKFKIGISSSSTKQLSDIERSELIDLKTKSFIIAGNEDIIFDDRLKPINQAQLKEKSYQNWKNISTTVFNNMVTITEETRNSIQKFINEVIDANIIAKKTAIRYQNEYFAEKKEMYKKIQNNKTKIQKLNDELFSMIHTRDVLPITVTSQHHKESILSDLKKRYLTYLHKLAPQKELIIDGLNNVQPKIVQLLIDNSLDYDEDFFIGQASKKIETVFKEYHEEVCQGALHGSIGTQNIESIYDEPLKEIIHPVLIGYQLPVIKIMPENVSEQVRLSLPIMLKVRCESIQRSFTYDEPNNFIFDSFTNIQWKLQANRYPMKRKHDNEDWDYPSLKYLNEVNQYLNDYQNFCTNYNSFYQEITYTYIYQKYPKIKCIKRFRVDKGYQNWIIRDMFRQEEWKIIENVNYVDLLAKIRNSNWQINTVESLSLFFNELKLDFKRDQVNQEIITMLSNKYFWTSTDISTRTKSAIMVNFETEHLSEIPEKIESICTGIVTRKIRGF